jgi:hypothetical protein
MLKPLLEYKNKQVVIATDTERVLFIGTLLEADIDSDNGRKYAKLKDADVHYFRDGGLSREEYLMDARKHGPRTNCKEVVIYDWIGIIPLEEILVNFPS